MMNIIEIMINTTINQGSRIENDDDIEQSSEYQPLCFIGDTTFHSKFNIIVDRNCIIEFI